MRESAVIVSLVPASLCTKVRGAGATSYKAKVERSHPSNSEATGEFRRSSFCPGGGEQDPGTSPPRILKPSTDAQSGGASCNQRGLPEARGCPADEPAPKIPSTVELAPHPHPEGVPPKASADLQCRPTTWMLHPAHA
eukprot:6069586-Amphidinium_carterae.2